METRQPRKFARPVRPTALGQPPAHIAAAAPCVAARPRRFCGLGAGSCYRSWRGIGGVERRGRRPDWRGGGGSRGPQCAHDSAMHDPAMPGVDAGPVRTPAVITLPRGHLRARRLASRCVGARLARGADSCLRSDPGMKSCFVSRIRPQRDSLTRTSQQRSPRRRSAPTLAAACPSVTPGTGC